MTTPAATSAPTASDATLLTGAADDGKGAGAEGKDGAAPGGKDAAAGSGSPADGKKDAAGQPGAGAGSETPPPPAELELKLPEGMAVDEALLGEFKPLAQELGLDSPKAQKLLDLYVKQQQAQLDKAMDDLAAKRQAWKDAVETDKELGGANLEATKTRARQAVEAYGGKELQDFLRETGFGDHPLLVRAFAAIGKAMAEDSIAGQRGAAQTPANSDEALLRAMYDHPSSAPLFKKE